jgi:hypothetical protein
MTCAAAGDVLDANKSCHDGYDAGAQHHPPAHVKAPPLPLATAQCVPQRATDPRIRRPGGDYLITLRLALRG